MDKYILHVRNVALNSCLSYKLSLIFMLIISQVSYSFSQDGTSAKCVSNIGLTVKYRINNEIAFHLLEGFFGYLGTIEIEDITVDAWVLKEDSVTFYLEGKSEIYTQYTFPYYNAIKTIDTNLNLIEDTVAFHTNYDCIVWVQTITGYTDRSINSIVFGTFFLTQFKIAIHRKSDFGMNLPVQTHISYPLEEYILDGGLIESAMPHYPSYNYEVYNLNGQIINSGKFDFKQKQAAIKKIESELPVPGIFVIRIFGKVYNERIKVTRF